MFRYMCRAKIHRATVSEADLDYEGSLTIPRYLMKKLDILPGERVEVANVSTGSRLTTYAITGDKPDYFCLNGAAARHGQPGDILIVMIYCAMSEKEARKHRVKVALMGPGNKLKRIIP